MNGLLEMVGANIKLIRSEKGLTREQLAEKCELQPSYLADVERGKRNITPNGLLEGQVNRLKWIKRMMYGRAKADLLEKRMQYRL